MNENNDSEPTESSLHVIPSQIPFIWYIAPVVMVFLGVIWTLATFGSSNQNFNGLILWWLITVLLFILLYFLDSILWLRKSVHLLSEKINKLTKEIENEK